MTNFFVREACDDDAMVLRRLIDTATQQLRCIYRPRKKKDTQQTMPAITLVAVDDEIVVATAEYVVQDDRLYIQGIAVHPNHRQRGFCRSLLAAVEQLAIDAELCAVVLCVIEETGNVGIFEKMGFMVMSHTTSVDYMSPTGGPVTQVEMGRKLP